MVIRIACKSILPAFIALLFPICNAFSQTDLMNILSGELDREFKTLQKEETPPYFMSYTVTDVYETQVSASFGVVTGSYTTKNRLFSVEVRVGDYTMDNTREIRGDQFGDFFDRYGGLQRLPMDNSMEKAIRMELWKETNDRYRSAVRRFAKVKSNVAVKVEAEDKSNDYSIIAEHPNSIEPPFDPAEIMPDIAGWEQKVKKYSSAFLALNDMFEGDARLSFRLERRYFVSTEGTRLAANRSLATLVINATVKAEDGMELPLYKTYSAFNPTELPSDTIVVADAKAIVTKLQAMKAAPVVDPYTGPAILSGRASGVFFHEIFGHRIEGHRQKKESEGQTFKKKIGEKVLPDFVDVYSDPTMMEFNGTKLLGYYTYDDEGVRGERVDVVKNGVFKNFLMSRSPIEGFPKSNGHGRCQAGSAPVSRQSNLIVATSNPIPYAALREMLIAECKKQNKEFGLIFEDIQGGFTMTGRTTPNAFNVLPTEVYRVYTDGRPDELVRGVDLVGTPLVMFSNITATGDKPEIFNGRCGAESGWVPVSAISPALFVSQIEVQKKTKSQERPALLPRPDADPEVKIENHRSF